MSNQRRPGDTLAGEDATGRAAQRAVVEQGMARLNVRLRTDRVARGAQARRRTLPRGVLLAVTGLVLLAALAFLIASFR